MQGEDISNGLAEGGRLQPLERAAVAISSKGGSLREGKLGGASGLVA